MSGRVVFAACWAGMPIKAFAKIATPRIFPQNWVQVDVLCSGVTRRSIQEQVRKAKGYHIVHWSGHGHQDLLALQSEDDQADTLSGAELVDLLQQGGGFIPELMFLSACHSGSMIPDQVFHDLTGQLLKDSPMPESKTLAEALERKGYSGTALELLRIGVKQVIGMRYAVGDSYARRLAQDFYRCLLAEGHAGHTALALARQALANSQDCQAELSAVDHATPLLFGANRLSLNPHEKRSAQHGKRYPQPGHPLLENDLKAPAHFIGRERELTRLNHHWLPRGSQPVAVIQGLAGLGKTSLAAESILLWHRRFDQVIPFQACGHAKSAEEFYRYLDLYLTNVSKDYREACREDDYLKIHLPNYHDDQGRYEKMRANLIDWLRNHPALLVIDNFETCLFANGDCQDPEWEALLTALSGQLSQSATRVLITSRHYPKALENRALWLRLGTLPMNEAALLLWEHPKLRDLWHQGDSGKALARDLLNISRGHPLIMQRLADLADDPALLTAALAELRQKGYRHLPELANSSNSAEERAYLEDVAIGAIDWLLKQISTESRRLLWLLTQALEDVPESLLQPIYSGLSKYDEALLKIQQALTNKPQLPAEHQEWLDALLPEIIAQATHFKADAKALSPIAPLLNELVQKGLVQKDGDSVHFHELVRERCDCWMRQHPEETEGLTAQQVLQRYGERYAAIFKALRKNNQIGESIEAGRRALTYFCRAQAFKELTGFAGDLIISTKDPQPLQAVIAELQALLPLVPEGKARWTLNTHLADALDLSGLSKAALPFYQQAASAAEIAEHWPDLAAICQNWANGLRNAGELAQASETFIRAAEVKVKAGSAAVDIIGSELEAYRTALYQGQSEQVLPEIEQRLHQLRGWWRQSQQGQTPAEVPDKEVLQRTLIGALDVAEEAQRILENWQACLELLQETADLQQIRGDSDHEQARTLFNNYWPLLHLRRLDQAQALLERCMQVFKQANDLTMQASALSALSNVWNERGHQLQAIALERQALALRERLEVPQDRAISHGNLANYLAKADDYPACAAHRLAQIIYCFVTGHRQDLTTALSNHAISAKQAAEAGISYRLPLLQDLVRQPEFAVLRDFIQASGQSIEALQAAVDELP
ncbi:MAG: CHAT domain-containing protein [Methylobacter sp.]